LWIVDGGPGEHAARQHGHAGDSSTRRQTGQTKTMDHINVAMGGMIDDPGGGFPSFRSSMDDLAVVVGVVDATLWLSPATSPSRKFADDTR